MSSKTTSTRRRSSRGSTTITMSWNKKMFAGIDRKVARKHLRKYIQDLCSGSANNPLMGHYADVQRIKNDPKWEEYKQRKHGDTNVFKETGNAERLLKAKAGKDKKYSVSYRKRGEYFLMTATIRKMEDGKNVYKFAQRGRFGGISGTSGGKKKTVKAEDYLSSMKDVNRAWKKLQEDGVETGRVKIQQFRAKLIGEKFNFDRFSTSRISKRERLVTANVAGDHRYVKQDDMSKTVESILKDSGYKLK